MSTIRLANSSEQFSCRLSSNVSRAVKIYHKTMAGYSLNYSVYVAYLRHSKVQKKKKKRL